MNIAMATVSLVVVAAIVRAHLGNGEMKKFNLMDAFRNKEGYFDFPKTAEATVFAVMTWGFIIQVATKNLSEWYVTTYVGAFVLRGAYSAWLKHKNDPPKP